ncbi:MAG: galactosyltransferase-related protein [Mangrovibacterium sp.]
MNLRATVAFLQKHFDTHIHILEADRYNSQLITTVIPNGVTITFVEDHDPIFYRTLYINQMLKVCITPFISIWETDIIVPPQQIIQSVEWLRSDQADFASPYEKKALDTSTIIRNLFLSSGDWQVLEKHQDKMKQMYPNPVGGAFFANRTAYIESGMDNLNIYGWGFEDVERVNRWKILGYRFKRVQGNLYHLTHSRGINSTFYSKEDRSFKLKELNRISSMTKEELKEEVSRWG